MSHLVIPLSVPFNGVVKKIDALLPKTDKEDWTRISKPGEDPELDLQYKLWRDPIQASWHERTLTVAIPVRYAATVRAKVKDPVKKDKWVWLTQGESWGTAKEPQLMTITVHAKLTVKDDWQIETDLHPEPIKFGPAPTDKICKKALVNICVKKERFAPEVHARISSYLEPKIEAALAKLGNQVDKALQLRGRAESLWKALQRPQSLQKAAQAKCPTAWGSACTVPAWMVMQPSDLGVTQIAMHDEKLLTNLSIVGKLAAVVGKKPKLQANPFPPLSQSPAAPAVDLDIGMSVPVKALGAALAAGLKKKHLEVPQKGAIQITNARVVGTRDPQHPHRLTVAVDVSGAVKGVLTLQGALHYDKHSHVLSVPTFDYDVETSNGLAKSLDQKNHEALRRLVASHARWDLSPQLPLLNAAVTKSLDQVLRNQLSVQGGLTELSVHDFSVQPSGVELRVSLKGAFAATYRPR